MKTIVINLFGEPGAGKSTMAAALFSRLKAMGVCCEITLEYAKELIYNETPKLLKNQLIVLGEQFSRLYKLIGKVNFIITDSPILLSAIYNKRNGSYSDSFVDITFESYKKFNNINFFLKRTHAYSNHARMQSEEESKKIAQEIKGFLNEKKISFLEIYNNKRTVDLIIAILKRHKLIKKN